MSAAPTTIAPLQHRTTLTEKLASRYGVDANKFLATLKATAFKVRDGEATNEQMMALLVVADQYKLNPFTRELFAFPDSRNGIVPVVSVDGWARIINEHPQADGIEFVDGPEEYGTPTWIECVIYRKDRQHPTKVRERLNEVRRDTQPWKSHPSRMLRHKALIQCARVAFGFAGIYDQDEAERIIEMGEAEVVGKQQPTGQQPYSDESLNKNLPAWRVLVESGEKDPEAIIRTIKSKHTLTLEQEAKIVALAAKPAEAKPLDTVIVAPAEWDESYRKGEERAAQEAQ
jgi:phage recombination protein Bet